MKNLCAALLLLWLPRSQAAQPATDQKPPHVVGIGASIKIVDFYPVVDALVPAGPAEKDGRLKPGDRIDAVAQDGEPWEETAGLKLEEAVQRIRGPKGS